MPESLASIPAVRVGSVIPDFEVVAYANGEVELFNLSDFEKHNVQLASVSMDSVYVHKAWVNSDNRLKDIRFPMISDNGGDLSRTFGTYCDKEKMSKRGTFIIDPDGILVSMEITNNSFGRNVDELICKIDAAAFVRANPGQACPASWKPGKSSIAIQLGKQTI